MKTCKWSATQISELKREQMQHNKSLRNSSDIFGTKVYRHSFKACRNKAPSHMNYWRCFGLNMRVVKITMSIFVVWGVVNDRDLISTDPIFRNSASVEQYIMWIMALGADAQCVVFPNSTEILHIVLLFIYNFWWYYEYTRIHVICDKSSWKYS